MNGWTPKVGDKARRVGGEFEGKGNVTRTIDFVGTEVVVFTSVYDNGNVFQRGMTRSRFEDRFEPAPEVFEAGKVYVLQANGVQVECLYADDTVALLVNQAGAKYLRSQESRSEYKEV